MVGGQMIDIETEGRDIGLEVVARLQRLKTGALIGVSVEGGTILAGASDEAAGALRGYAQDLGLAYQIADDLLDYEGNQEELGKAVRKDAARGKASFVAVLGLDGARAEARRLAAQAKARLDQFGPRADILRSAVDYVLERRG
jgi:farnesyl diphosphate synthase